MELLTLANLGWVVTVVVAFMLGKGAVDKVRGTKEMVGNFEFMKLSKYRMMVGVGELLGVVLLLIPATSLYGAILIGSFMSAAVALHLSLMDGFKTNVPLLLGLGAFLGHLLRLL